jgi:fibronectin type 3 domain-containing protein
MSRAIILMTVAALTLTSCGTPGAPQPPSLQLPTPPQDLTAVRKGNKVTLSWTMPNQTTDGATVRASKLGPTKICRGLADPLAYCTDAQNIPENAGRFVGQLSPAQTPIPKEEHGAPKLTYTDTLSEQFERQHPTDFATYAVQIFNSHGHAASLSNQVKIPLAPVDRPPTDIKAEMSRGEVALWWFEKGPISTNADVQQGWRVTRRQDNPPAVTPVACASPDAVEHAPPTDCADHSFAWETTYYYRVTPITRVMKDGKVIAEVEGDDSPEVKVFTRDIYAPAAPTGVQAVFSGTGQKPFMDITWAPNTEDDLAGYNIYRHEQGTAPEKLNAKLIPSPSFRDDNVQPGHTYIYSVSAVDLRNNESPRSEDTSETIPK